MLWYNQIDMRISVWKMHKVAGDLHKGIDKTTDTLFYFRSFLSLFYEIQDFPCISVGWPGHLEIPLSYNLLFSVFRPLFSTSQHQFRAPSWVHGIQLVNLFSECCFIMSKNRFRNQQRLVGRPMSSGLMLKADERSRQHTHEVRRLGSRSDFTHHIAPPWPSNFKFLFWALLPLRELI